MNKILVLILLFVNPEIPPKQGMFFSTDGHREVDIFEVKNEKVLVVSTFRTNHAEILVTYTERYIKVSRVEGTFVYRKLTENAPIIYRRVDGEDVLASDSIMFFHDPVNDRIVITHCRMKVK